MKKAKNITIKVSTPCSENWETLTETEHGRFCKRCNKTVTDFTGLSDQEIFSLITQSKGSACGRFRESQLHRQIVPVQQQTSGYNWFRLFTPLLFSQFTNAHDVHRIINPKQNDVSFQRAKPGSEQADKTSTDKDLPYIVKGHVYDSTLKVGLSSVSVMVRNRKYNCLTDSNGFFQLQLPAKYATKNFAIRIASVGYNFLTVKIENKKGRLNKDVEAYLHLRTIDENEVIVVGGYSAD